MSNKLTIVDSDTLEVSGIEMMNFPGGEPHVKVPIFTGDVLLFMKCRKESCYFRAALLIDALERQPTVSTLYTFIPYFPAARQDRVSDGKAALTLQVMGQLLRTKRPTGSFMAAFDVHSPKTLEYTSVAKNYMPSDLDIPQQEGVVGIIAPDKGAVERASDFRDAFYPGVELIECTKSRNPTTGYLSDYHMPELTHAGHYIIVDDICDGGRTFNNLVDVFKQSPVAADSTLELFVSHGIFSAGLDAISHKISKITTTNSWCERPESERLRVIPLEPLFGKIIQDGNSKKEGRHQ